MHGPPNGNKMNGQSVSGCVGGGGGRDIFIRGAGGHPPLEF